MAPDESARLVEFQFDAILLFGSAWTVNEDDIDEPIEDCFPRSRLCLSLLLHAQVAIRTIASLKATAQLAPRLSESELFPRCI